MSSLVVLRSWSDRQQPVVTKIAEDNDKDQQVIIKPDHKGRFVTEKVIQQELQPPTIVEGSMKSSASNLSINEKSQPPQQQQQHPHNYNKFGISQFKFWQKKDKYNCSSSQSSSTSNSCSSSASSPSPPIRNENNSSSGNSPHNNNSNQGSRSGSADSAYCDTNLIGTINGKLHLSLSRESSTPSLNNIPIGSSGSPPSSPSTSSRYKNLGPELAATIPKRQIIRKSWVRGGGGAVGTDGNVNSGSGIDTDSYYSTSSNLVMSRKKEMSQSTPALNTISIVGFYSSSTTSTQSQPSQPSSVALPSQLIEEQHQEVLNDNEKDQNHEQASYISEEEEETPANNDKENNPGKGQLNSSELNTSTIPSSSAVPIPKKRPLSYADSLYVDNELKEPTFGDTPASVVGVIKKDPASAAAGNRRHSASLQHLLGNIVRVNDFDSPKLPASSTAAISDKNEQVSVAQAQVQENSVTLQNVPEPPPAKEEQVKETAKVTEQAAAESEESEFEESSEEEFTVHSVEHVPLEQEGHKKSLQEEEEDQWISSGNEENDIKEEEQTDSELKALVDEIDDEIVSTTTSSILEDNNEENNKNLHDNKNMIQNFVVKKPYETHRTTVIGTRNGMAYAQVPIQCINQHVIVPPSYNNKKIPQQQDQLSRTTSNDEYIQRRKTFCDELLNNDNQTTAFNIKSTSSPDDNNSRAFSPLSFDSMSSNGIPAPSMTPPPVPRSVLPSTIIVNSNVKGQQMLPNHEGIIFFDEEDEYEHESLTSDVSTTVPDEHEVEEDAEDDDDNHFDEKSSIAPSERENLFEYMSVCHNNFAKPNSPEGSTLNLNSTSLLSKTTSPIPTNNNVQEAHSRVGIDIGSTFTRFSLVSNRIPYATSSHSRVIRSMITSDGLAFGYKSLCHSMSTKSKLIYKWKPATTTSSSASPTNIPTSLLFDELYNNYNEEEFNQILEIMFKYFAKMHYKVYQQQLLDKTTAAEAITGGRSKSSPTAISPTTTSASTTKPAITIWNLSIVSGMDKKLIREIAYNTKLVKKNDELRLINESTASAVTCYEFLKTFKQQQPLQNHFHHHPQGRNKLSSTRLGKTFLSVNIGSTFIHSSSYELLRDDGKLAVISPSESQLYETIETQFIGLFSRVFSPEFILKYESRFTPGWIELLIRFDEMKNEVFKNESKPYLFLPISFYIEFFKCTGMQVPECLEDNPEEGLSWDNNGAICFNKELLEDWLIQPILSFLRTKLSKTSYDHIVLSGGNAYDFAVYNLEKEFPNTNIHKVPNPENAVLNGLVNLDTVKISFKSPFWVGVGVMTPFDEKIHPKDKCVVRNGKQWCSDVWDNLIKKGQTLTIGEVILKRTYVGAQPGQNVLCLPIFKCYADEPKLLNSPSVEKCCELRFEIAKEKSWREVQLIIKCYESELAVIASGTDGIINQVAIDF